MVLSEAIADFRECARHELGHTANTSYACASWHRNFAHWLEEQGITDPPIQDISVGLLRRYAYRMSSRSLRPRTIRGALIALRALFVYLVKMEALAENPALSVRLPKAEGARYVGEVDEDEEDDPELGHHPLHISEVSAELRAALVQAPIGLTGMRSVRAIGPEGQRFSAGLYGDDVFLLQLP